MSQLHHHDWSVIWWAIMIHIAASYGFSSYVMLKKVRNIYIVWWRSDGWRYSSIQSRTIRVTTQQQRKVQQATTTMAANSQTGLHFNDDIDEDFGNGRYTIYNTFIGLYYSFSSWEPCRHIFTTSVPFKNIRCCVLMGDAPTTDHNVEASIWTCITGMSTSHTTLPGISHTHLFKSLRPRRWGQATYGTTSWSKKIDDTR